MASAKCVRCDGASPLTAHEAREALKPLPGWVLTGGTIEKEFHFKFYSKGLDFAYAVGKIAEEQNHHPDMLVSWKRVRLTFSTHAINGLSENDFIMAAKAELTYLTTTASPRSG